MIRHPGDMMINDTIHHHGDTVEIKPLILLIWRADDEGLETGRSERSRKQQEQRGKQVEGIERCGKNVEKREKNDRKGDGGGDQLNQGRQRDGAPEDF